MRQIINSRVKRMSLVFAVCVLGLASAQARTAQALTYQNEANVEFSINPTIGVSLSASDLIIDDLVPGKFADSNIITVSVNTNASHGYYLSATAGTAGGNTDLTMTNPANSNYKFTNLTGNKATLDSFEDNNWGYAYSTDSGTSWVSGNAGSAAAGYNGLPLDNGDNGATGVTLINTTSPLANNSVQFKIGAKASAAQASGTYNGIINFYAVTNPEPILYMQDMTTAKLNQLMPSEHSTIVMRDKRDDQEYTIARLKDGKYWMTKNLNLAGGTTLTSELTDFDSSYTIPSDQGWQEGGKLPNSSTSGFSNDNHAYVYNSGKTGTDCSDPGCYSYYSWDAATLGSGRSISADNTDAPYSICPKGWHLPTSRNASATNWQTTSDFYKLATFYGMSTSSPSENTSDFYNQAGPNTTVPGFLLSGHYNNGSFLSGDSYGYYWSATSGGSSTYARNLRFDSGSVDSANNSSRRYGFAVRCVFGE